LTRLVVTRCAARPAHPGTPRRERRFRRSFAHPAGPGIRRAPISVCQFRLN